MKRQLMKSLVATVLLAMAVACPLDGPPDPDQIDDAGQIDDASQASDAGAGDQRHLDVATSDAGSEDAAADQCQQLKEQLRQELSVVGSCTVVVRQQPYGDNLLFQVICGAYDVTSEAQARATAESATGLAASATTLHQSTPDDEFVFYAVPDTQGGAAAVSVRTGLAVFGATLDSENRSGNAITYPVSWRPASALGAGCRSSHSIAPELISAYDLAQGTAIEMPEEWALIAAARLDNTVLPDAMVEAGYIFDLVALYYVALGFGPGDEAENVLLLNGGWLE